MSHSAARTSTKATSAASISSSWFDETKVAARPGDQPFVSSA
jgi:hypothetical protein